MTCSTQSFALVLTAQKTKYSNVIYEKQTQEKTKDTKTPSL